VQPVASNFVASIVRITQLGSEPVIDMVLLVGSKMQPEI
jgi:hypothetical protein